LIHDECNAIMDLLNRAELLARLRTRRPDRPAAPWIGVVAAGSGALAAGAGCLAVALAVLPPHMAFPVTAAGLLVAAAMTSLMACATPAGSAPSRLMLWDFAGALSLIGLAAALFGEPEQAVALLERNR
jgi:hypothetical protein